MPKAYKICPVQVFKAEKFGRQPFYFEVQQGIPGVPQGPQTSIFRSHEELRFQDFQAFIIEHEYEVHTPGRFMDMSFSAFIAKGAIHAYFSSQQQLLLLAGKKADILDFCKRTPDMPDVKITVLQVDMKALQERLAEIRLAWFHFRSGRVTASALMGVHLEETDAFHQAKSVGDISSLSFYLEDRNGTEHPLMLTDDGAVVLQRPYEKVSEELDIVLYARDTLLSGICTQVDAKFAKRPPWHSITG